MLLPRAGRQTGRPACHCAAGQHTSKAHIGRCVIISWYENSSRSVTWITPSSTSTRPYASDSNTQMSYRSSKHTHTAGQMHTHTDTHISCGPARLQLQELVSESQCSTPCCPAQLCKMHLLGRLQWQLRYKRIAYVHIGLIRKAHIPEIETCPCRVRPSL